MSDGIKKYALIVNGDREERHVENVDMALGVLEKMDYETFVVSVKRPDEDCDHYVNGSYAGLKRMTEFLKKRIDSDDELLIYTTGHGAKDSGLTGLCFENTCRSDSEVGPLLDEIPFGTRFVVMDQCYGGNWASRFSDDASSFFISAGSKDEETCCNEFAPYFWKRSVADLNHNGKADIEDRYLYAKKAGLNSMATPMYVEGQAIQRADKTGDVYNIDTADGLRDVLATVKNGRHAVVFFSWDQCPHCRNYWPVFKDLARKDRGNNIFIRVTQPSAAWEYQISSFPTVVVFEPSGRRSEVDRNKVLSYLDVHQDSADDREEPVAEFEVESANAGGNEIPELPAEEDAGDNEPFSVPARGGSLVDVANAAIESDECARAAAAIRKALVCGIKKKQDEALKAYRLLVPHFTEAEIDLEMAMLRKMVNSCSSSCSYVRTALAYLIRAQKQR